jgi:hypothetical protein
MVPAHWAHKRWPQMPNGHVTRLSSKHTGQHKSALMDRFAEE